MFCSKCGTSLSEGQNFCPNCGAIIGAATNNGDNQQSVPVRTNSPIAESVSGYPDNTPSVEYGAYPGRRPSTATEYRDAERNDALDELQRAYQWFSQKQGEYDEYDSISDRLPRMNRVGKRPLLIWGCIIATVCLITTIALSSETGRFFGPGFIGILIGAAMIVGFFLIEANRKKKIVELNNRLDQLGQELTDHYISFGKCSFGAEYSNPQIISRILNLVRSGRADNIKEGINVMISDLRMDQMAELSRITAENAQIIARNSAAAARGAKAAAVFSAASFFLK